MRTERNPLQPLRHGLRIPRGIARAALPAMLALSVLGTPAPAATSRVSGRVIDSDSQKSIADAEIELANTNGGQGFHRAHTRKNGEFAIEGISSDRYYT